MFRGCMGLVIAVCAFVVGNVVQASPLDELGPEDLRNAQNVALLTEDYPPYNFIESDELRGVGADVVQAMANAIGYHKRMEVLPWKRVMLRLEDEAEIGVFSMTRTPQREEMYAWVGPIVKARVGLYQLTERRSLVHSVQGLRYVEAIGVQAGGAHEQALLEYGFENLEPIFNQGSGIQMLAVGRIDLLVSSDIELFEQLKKTELTLDELELVYSFGSGDLYLAFSKQTSVSALTAWQAAYDHIVENGQFDMIMEKYGMIGDQYPLFEGDLSIGQ
ncbi:MAG: transporter substrate-binding domain-containing protein [Thalassospira sp.]|uniref:substrate-binding periplasmic protein n=1 Tax=Thalassospira sp. TaxID=1912094 RepID=UPI0032EF25EB